MPFCCQRCLPTLWSQIRLFLRKQNKQNERREERLHFKHLHYLNTLHLLRSCLKSLCAACMHTKSLQLCLTLCNPMDHSLLGSSVHGILQARLLEWVAMTSSRGASQLRDQTHISYVSLIGGWFFTTNTTWEAQKCPVMC